LLDEDGLAGERAPGAWRDELVALDRELARDHGFEEMRADAERRAAATADLVPLQGPEGPLPRPACPGARRGAAAPSTAAGIPYHATTGTTPPANDRPPELQLVADGVSRDEAVLNASVQWLGLLAAVWLVSFFPGVLALARPLWPEQVAVLGGLGWYLAGPTPVALGLLTLAALARSCYLVGWGRGLLHRFTAAPAPSVRGQSPGPAPPTSIRRS
jgi:hypothetical protein